jgi:glutathionylspermidine synthase
VTPPWLAVEPLAAPDLARLRRRAIFDCCKWDPQVEDVATVAGVPLVLRRETWVELAGLAEALAQETLAAEAELLARPDLHRRLALPRAVRAALARARREGMTPGVARLIRFDFHHTPDGWRISEANTDVPGGLNEASGFPALLAPHYPGATPVGDPAAAYVAALLAAAPAGAVIALVHATAYSDDRQVMSYLADRLAAAGARPELASPDHLRWSGGRARLETAWSRDPVDLIVRFFPAEWLPNLPRAADWPRYFAGATTPMSNPAAALLTQSKRLPLVWDDLATPLPTWRAVLPETRDPRAAPWRREDGWVLKPALGRVGEDVAISGVASPKDWRRVSRAARWYPGHWIAQRRFEATRFQVNGTALYPCVGVYTVDRRAVGAYGRLASRPLIDWRAQDAAILAVAEHGG